MGKSLLWRVWKTKLDFRVCLDCKELHGKIYSWVKPPLKGPPMHFNCRCDLLALETIVAGRATQDGMNGADFWLVHYGKLPEYYVTYSDARTMGWNPKFGNLAEACPGKMIARGQYYNKNGKLPSISGRIWYEADINYRGGIRGTERILYSSDGLVFVTYDHYETFYEIVKL